MKHALRQLLKSPAYTALAVGALALAIGANTVLFSAINTLFLRPLPLPEAERIVHVYAVFSDRALAQAPVSWPRFSVFRDQQDRFAAFAAMSFTGLTLTGPSEPELLQARRVTHPFFDVLGVRPVLGRTFTPADDAPGGADVVVLSQAFWQRHFSGSPQAVGRTLVLDGRPHTVIGVLPRLPFPFEQAQVWAPRPFETEGIAADLRERGTGFLNVYGRLRPAVTIEQAAEHLRVVNARYATAYPDKVDIRTGLSLVPLQEDLVGAQRPMFLTLLAAVGCVLLVACANVANLLLARFTARRKEIAIRAALGATRARIIRQFLAESVLTAGIAGALGVLVATWGIDALARLGADFIPRAAELNLDGRVLGFAVLLSLVTGLVLGFVPAWQASRAEAGETLKDSSRGTTGGRHTGRFRSALLVAEVAVSLVLLVGAALLVDSFRRLHRVDPGFRSDDVTVFQVGLPAGQYPTPERQSQFFEQALERLRALPGVTHAGAVAGLPLGDGAPRGPVAREGDVVPPMGERILVRRATATPGLFAALDIPILRGRDFTWRDRNGATNVVMINDVLAKRLFPGEDPIGRRLITGIQSVPREVVGVYRGVRTDNLGQLPGDEMYYPSMQIDSAFQTFVVRSTRPAATLRTELAAAIHAVDPGLPLLQIEPYSQLIAGAVADRKLATVLIGGFAALALILAAMGIYSVVGYSVAQRTNEFGIRLALGAEPRMVLRMVLGEGLRLATIGLAVGLAISAGLTRLLQQQLYEVSPTDPLILGSVAGFLCAIAALACFVPALRATKVDPITALRAE